LAALCIPTALLGLVEAGLRIGGFGVPSGFFLPARVGDRPVWIDNAQFTRRYFPAGLARSPQPIVLDDPKPAGRIRIFVLGESAAMGDPEPAYGFPRMLEVLLDGRHPGRRFEVVNVAVTAINSHVVRRIAKDCAPREGDVWIVYMGNNEVVGPFGPGTVFGAQAPSLGFIRAAVAIRETRLGQALERLGGVVRRNRTAAQWGGMEMFLREQVTAEDPRLEVTYAHFRRNLEDIVRMGRRARARVIVGNVAVNLRDSPPFASRRRANLAADDAAAWDRHLAAGVDAAEAGDAAEAARHYQEALRQDDRHAELHYRLGRAQLQLGQAQEAAASLARARDLDTLRFRADSRLNALTREVAQTGNEPGVWFVDLEAACAAQSADGVPGESLFYEHVHLNPDGNYRVARCLAEAVEQAMPELQGGKDASAANWLSAAACRDALALTAWDERRVWAEMLARVRQPPFTNQADSARREERWEERLRELDAALAAGALATGTDMYGAALAARPDDWVLRESFARFLQAHGRSEEAEAQWREAVALAPHHAAGYSGLGDVLDAMGRHAEALRCHQTVVELQPDSVEAHHAIGLALTNLGRQDEAVRAYRRALRVRPDFTEARINLGQLLADLDRDEEAMEQYREAVRITPDSAAAHVNMGNLLWKQGRVDGALQAYAAALRADPDHAVAHYNAGRALAERDPAKALEHFAAAARIRPDFAEARYQFGLALVRAGRQAEALRELTEAARLQPDVAEARLNLGVVLATAGRYADAIREFQACLRLAPENPTAARYLELAQDRMNQAP
jgi:tetratricopeptide (TPR) repeat protein